MLCCEICPVGNGSMALGIPIWHCVTHSCGHSWVQDLRYTMRFRTHARTWPPHLDTSTKTEMDNGVDGVMMSGNHT